MCRAFEEWMEDCRTEGIKEGHKRRRNKFAPADTAAGKG